MTTRKSPSDGADRARLQMAQEEGRAYRKSLDCMANEVADKGAHQTQGDYIVAIAQERAEGMYDLAS